MRPEGEHGLCIAISIEMHRVKDSNFSDNSITFAVYTFMSSAHKHYHAENYRTLKEWLYDKKKRQTGREKETA